MHKNPVLVFVFLAGAIIACAWLVHSPGSLVAHDRIAPDRPAGRVLGASETAAQYDIYEVLDIKRLPEARAKAVREPIPTGDPEILDFDARAALAIDAGSEAVLYESGANEPMPIASISKLVTALVYIHTQPDWDQYYLISRDDLVDLGRAYLVPGEEIKLIDLFRLSLVASANDATMALVHSTGMSEPEFVEEMNKWAAEHGFINTRFEDPVGFSINNVSNANEIARIALLARDEPRIREAISQPACEWENSQGRKAAAATTNYLLRYPGLEGISVLGGKTGYTKMAGSCLVNFFADQEENEIITVVLGGREIMDRFSISRRLAAWVYDNFQWN